ncbi:MAG TPA: SCO family protein [Opitutaceae bacterium]
MPFRACFGPATLLLLAAALTAPLAFAAERVFEVTGVIRSRLEDGRLVIAHDKIEGFMPAMTMAFAVAHAADTAALVPGDRVRFRFRVGETKSFAEAFAVLARASEAPAAPPPHAASVKRSRLRAGDAMPAFSLVDERGQPFGPADLRDRLTIVTFIFTRCPVPEFCPTMARRFGQLQEAIQTDPTLAARARLLSVTLDPEFDRPDVLDAYARAVGAVPSVWRFATGDRTQIDALTKAFAVYTERNGVTLDHTLCTALLGPDGRVVEIWRGNGWRVEEVLAVLRQTP